MNEVLFFIFAFLSEIIGTMAGFGSSTIFLPLALLFFDFKTTLVLVALMHIFGNIGRISFFQHGLDKANAEAMKSSPFVMDAFHDTLAAKLYPELQRRGILK